MEAALTVITAISDWAWSGPLTILVIALGVICIILTKGNFTFNWKFNFKNTYGTIGKKEKDSKGVGTISSFAAACTALGNTIGTGNIVGVSTAIATGGPGAVFWMWVTGLLGCSTKAVEIIIGQRYRVKYKNIDEYSCNVNMALHNAFGLKTIPIILAVVWLIIGPFAGLVQVESCVSSCEEAFNLNSTIATILICGTAAIVILGGLRRISEVMSKFVPVMVVCYFAAVIILLVMNYQAIIPSIILIFKCAFSPAAAAGGFAGATVREAIRYGVARGMFSNDAGNGFGIVAHSGATTDHPVRQASWGWGEVFVDTLVICTLSALCIITTGVYQADTVSTSSLVAAAFSATLGQIGSGLVAIVIVFFAWSSLVAVYYAMESNFKSVVGDKKWLRKGIICYAIYYILVVTFMSGFDATLLWGLQDIINIFNILSVTALVLFKSKEIRRLYNDFHDRFIPAQERGENPEPVSYAEEMTSTSMFN